MADETGGDREYKEGGVSFGLIVAGIVAIAFVAQNSNTTDVSFLFFNATVPLSVVIIISMILGALLAWTAGVIRRRRKRRDELSRLER